MSRTALATIHLGALRRNLARVRERAGTARVMAVVKADGYGHGLERVARALAGADAFGVAALGDGLRLRAAGIDKRVVVLSGPDEAADIAEFQRLGLDAVIHHEAQLQWLEADRSATSANAHPLRVWLKIDTGMHRLGFVSAQVRDVHARLRALPNVEADSVLMTHFAASDEFDSPTTPAQIAAFDAATRDLPGPRALANSAGVLGWPAACGAIQGGIARESSAPAVDSAGASPGMNRTRDDEQVQDGTRSSEYWVRVGGLLYGLSVIAGKTGADLGFEPAMTLSTKLISVKRIPCGERVGYAGTYRCPEDMPVGVAAIGYGDGYPRSVPSGTPVVVNSVRTAIIGRVSMDLIAIDLRNVPNVQVGDLVQLWGGNLPVEEVAARAGTISYDLTCGVTRRVLFVEDEV
ncbi:MAG: alanine racemase [Rudaea sp.]